MSTLPVVLGGPTPLVLTDLKPALNPILVTDGAGIEKMKLFLARKGTEAIPTLGLDTETNVVVDFYWRRVRTIQVGDKDEQYVIDLLPFAGSEHNLIDSQGNDGLRARRHFAPIIDALRPVLCTNRFLKVGANLQYEYEVLRWNLGLRIWNLYSVDMAERVIRAGSIGLKQYSLFSLAALTARYMSKSIDKTEQTGFDLKTPLTQSQIYYGALDIRLPLAVRQHQQKITTRDQLDATCQIENDAIGSYTDMHINGQRMNSARWMMRINKAKAKLSETYAELDSYFIPVVGDKDKAIDQELLIQLEDKWRSLDIAGQDEKEAVAAYKAVSAKKEPVRRAELKAVAEQLEKNRKDLKAAAKVTFSELSKKRTKAKNLIEKCAGQALINYNSGVQVLAALKQIRGYAGLDGTSDDELLVYNDKPLIQAFRRYRKLKKDTGTYGEQWTKQWITKPCKEEGWLHPGDGRLHCVFNQLEAETGRSSSTKPNGQNLPKEDEVRACFCADDPDENIRISVCCDADTSLDKYQDSDATFYVCDECHSKCETKPEEYCIVTVDMSGAELRIIADLANAKSWIDAFNKGQDVHSVSTEILYPELWPKLACKGGELYFDKEKNKEIILPPCAYYLVDENGVVLRQKCKCPEHVTLRNGAKSTNFLLCYGGGPSALADALGISLEKAKELYRLHESKFPDIWGFLKRSGEQARLKKEARDMYGRRRTFPDPTWDGAKEFFIQEHDDRLELEDDAAALNILNFKKRELREPDEDEEYRLTHRDPTTKEIAQMYKGMFASIERKGKNHGIQGTNASIIKRAMGCGFDKNGKGYLWHLLPTLKAKLLSMVHDELILQCPKRHGQKVLEMVGDSFTRAAAEVMTRVAMTWEGHVSDRWMK